MHLLVILGALALLGLHFLTLFAILAVRWRRRTLRELDRGGPGFSGDLRQRLNGGWVYIVLAQLVERGLVRRTEHPGTPARGGNPRFYYELTAAGTRAARETREALGQGHAPAARQHPAHVADCPACACGILAAILDSLRARGANLDGLKAVPLPRFLALFVPGAGRRFPAMRPEFDALVTATARFGLTWDDVQRARAS